MKKKDTVLLLGIISILILVTAQFWLVRGIWNQKDEMFVLRYTLRSQEALSFISRRMQNNGFDTVRYILGRYSESANRELHEMKDKNQLEAKKKEVLEFFTEVLNREQDLSELLAAYFERRGFEKNFKVNIVINSLEMINNDTLVIYQSPEYINLIKQERSGRQSPVVMSGSRILVNWFRMEDNNYRLLFDYYIDFTDKQKLLLRETSLSFGMSILSILVVVIIYVVTYRNLREEKRLSNLKTDFINNMTHELKTPLSTITVAGRTLEMEKIRRDDDKIVETAKLIGKQSVHLNQLINMILEISMWERTQFELEKKQVDLEDLMSDIIECFRSGCGNCASINTSFTFKGAKADIDVVYFTTMINNLLSNAVKYSERDPEIRITGNSANNTITISISDNGIGITRNDQKRIFDKFYRAQSGNIHKFKGLGLGLYYVKKIAEAHGGDVTVSSRPGKGSTFTIIIPHII
jgi:two-component system phosphate regulon sensor histidine kinase PhoR